jgi:hypothetical protein
MSVLPHLVEGGEGLVLEVGVLPAQVRLHRLPADDLGVIVVVDLGRGRRKCAAILLHHESENGPRND